MHDHETPVDDRDALVVRIEQLEARMEAMAGTDRRAVRPGGAEVAEVADVPEVLEVGADAGPVSRRRLIGMAGAAAAGAVGATVLAAAPAAAADGDPVLMGFANTATLQTTVSNNAPGAWAIRGANGAASGAGVSGVGTVGVAGFSSVLGGTGVQGSSTIGYGVAAVPGLTSQGSHMRLEPHTAITGPPTSSLHSLGELWMDQGGALFQCVVAGTPGTWVRQAPLVTLAAPSRVYDSRAGQPNPSGSPQGSLAFGAAARTINCSPAVPAGATTILFNLTATGTAGSGAGALLVWAAGASEPLASSINWSTAGQTLANSVTSGCNGSQDVQVKCVASAGSSTQFILDVIGYYL